MKLKDSKGPWFIDKPRSFIQWKAYTELYLIWEQFLELFQAPTGSIGFGFNLNRENIILPLNQEIHLIVLSSFQNFRNIGKDLYASTQEVG